MAAMPAFSRGFGSVSAERVADLEGRLGVTLPDDYKQFMQTVNGGVPEPDSFAVLDRGHVMIGVLYGILDPPASNDLLYENEELRSWDELPDGFVAIGEDPGGNRLLMKIAGERAGGVYFWDRKGFYARDDGINLFLVAASFSVFLESLQDQRQ